MTITLATETETNEFRGMFTTPAAVLTALFAGNATITTVSRKTGKRYTYKIVERPGRTPREAPAHFVKLLTGDNNESDYTYLGMLTKRGVKLTAASRYKADSEPVAGLSWLTQHVANGSLPSERIEVWHEGRCVRCGRKLTVPESIARGLGPDCAEHV